MSEIEAQYQKERERLDRQFHYSLFSIVVAFFGGIALGYLVAQMFALSGVLIGVLLGGAGFVVCYALLMWYGATRIDWNNG